MRDAGLVGRSAGGPGRDGGKTPHSVASRVNRWPSPTDPKLTPVEFIAHGGLSFLDGLDILEVDGLTSHLICV